MLKRIGIILGVGIILAIVVFGWWIISRPDRGTTGSVSTRFRWLGPNVILDVPKEMLDKARGFDKNNWPDVSDPRWRQEMYGYYGAEPYWDYIL